VRRDEVIARLAAHKAELEALSVRSLSLFGSVARDEATPASDIDILVEFDKPVGLFEFLEVKAYLEALLDSRVDLVTPAALKSGLRERILREAVHAT
jgi:uncharacterized protein